MLFLARVIYSDRPGRDPAELIEFPDAGAIRVHLLANFVPAAYDHHRDRVRSVVAKRRVSWKQSDVHRWLQYFAQHANGGEIAWWRLESSIPAAPSIVVFGFALGSVGAIAGIAAFGALFGLFSGVLCAAASGVLGRSVGFVPLRINLSLRGRGSEAAKMIAFCVLFGALAGMIGYPLVEMWGWFGFAPAAVFAAVIAGLVKGWFRRSTPAAVPILLEVQRLATGALAGGLAIGLVGWFAQAPTGYPEAWIVLGVASGIFSGLADAFNDPIQVNAAVGPVVLLEANRYFTLTYSVMTALAYGVVIAAIVGPVRGAICGVAIGVVYAMCMNSWGRWVVLCRFWLPLTGRLPWATVRFLQDAHRREVLRGSGATYQFRHILLRDSILNTPEAVQRDKSDE